jgi:hypothetical protein
MDNSKDDQDDLDRIGNRNTPQGSTQQDQQRRHQDMSRQREQDSGDRSTADISRDSETRGNEDDRERFRGHSE